MHELLKNIHQNTPQICNFKASNFNPNSLPFLSEKHPFYRPNFRHQMDPNSPPKNTEF